jgi:hypothetical protein
MSASSAPCLRAARKNKFAAGKNIGTEKNTFGSRKKTPCSGKKLFLQRGKTPATNAFAAGKIQSSKKSTFAAEKIILEAAEKPSEVGKNCPRQKKNQAEAGKKLAAEKAQLCNPKVAATCNGKIHFRSGKKQQPQFIETRRS